MIDLARQPLVLMGIEATLVAAALLALFHLRSRFGLSPLFIALGAFQHLQVLLAATLYVTIAPGLAISPGSAVLFTASLFAILLVYIREDALAARRLIYGLVLANLILSLLSFLFALHVGDPATRNVFDLPRSFFVQSPRILIAGTLALALDVILIIVVYEAFSRYLQRFLWLHIYASMAVVLTVDTLVFATASFLGQGGYGATLAGGVVGKLLMALLFSSILTLYLQRREGEEVARQEPELRDVFHFLTYREKYEALREKLTRDPLTQLYNRGFFDDILPRELAMAERLGRATSLLMIDVDGFKKINDEHGHTTGDLTLQRLAAVLRETARATDLPCRFGGDEFALILANADRAQAAAIGERIRSRLIAISLETGAPPTLTTGVATFPTEAGNALELVQLADRRLYEGKRAGGDRVIAG